jgi:hypothetical protein
LNVKPFMGNTILRVVAIGGPVVIGLIVVVVCVDGFAVRFTTYGETSFS